jgi:isocitrate dehydrogenase
MSQTSRITVAHGDGIGPEIMGATLRVLEAAGARLAPETIEIGEAVYRAGESAGIKADAWDSLRRTKVFLKAPITTPQGGGYKSLNVTVRKTLGLYANVRPCVSYDPFVRTHFPDIDTVIVRENEEDLYAGIEHQQTDEVYQCLKLITRPGCERIIRYAFEYARVNGRKKVTCMSKDNIMKLTDGLFHRVFDEVAAEYPDIEADHMIIDIGAARLATRPATSTSSSRSTCTATSSPTSPRRSPARWGWAARRTSARRSRCSRPCTARPRTSPARASPTLSGLLLAAIQMLVHLGQGEVASASHNAWLKTLEDGIHTGDIFRDPEYSKERVGTKGFTDAVIERLGDAPATLPKAARAASGSSPGRSRGRTRSSSGSTSSWTGTATIGTPT